ncbi:receptor-like protein 34 [Juglans regia]|uniref:Receptor-like protein 34 n=1 Tax=Juglans regia TaxID=51240 RepID=A0A6P9F5I4_JUGRE|nr:receptor-like protein 34 [Juglans regia]
MIDLSQNQLQGHLPRSLAYCTELEYLDVGSNQINDTDPFWLGTLQQLKILVLHSNGFHGAIRSPETNYTFPNLRIIDLSHNYFSGNLPVGYFAQWDAMKSVGAKNLKYLDGHSVNYSMLITIKGVELEYNKIQDGLTVIDFSCNRFEGDIPEILGNLEGLHALNLSNNAFTGPIPQGQQFGTFPNTSFEDNQGLCGKPLSKICGDSDISTPPPSTFEENQGPKLFFEFGWKVVVMGYGCGFVFGIVIGHIVTTRKQDWLIKIFGKKQHQTRISRVNRRVNRRK